MDSKWIDGYIYIYTYIYIYVYTYDIELLIIHDSWKINLGWFYRIVHIHSMITNNHEFDNYIYVFHG